MRSLASCSSRSWRGLSGVVAASREVAKGRVFVALVSGVVVEVVVVVGVLVMMVGSVVVEEVVEVSVSVASVLGVVEAGGWG